MKKFVRFSLKSIILISVYVTTACSDPAAHITKISLKNDSIYQAKLFFCKDNIHCASVSDLWQPKKIDPGETQVFTVSNEETSVFKVVLGTKGKSNVRCLRIKPDTAYKSSQTFFLSTSTGC
jgi:hypothetical protein